VRERSATLADANRELTWFSKRALQIQEQERRSLALELHDQIGQELASLVLSLSRCEREMAGARQQEARSAVQDSIEIARRSLRRRPQHGAGPAPGDAGPAGIDSDAASGLRASRRSIRVARSWWTRTLSPSTFRRTFLIAAFRIVQEAVHQRGAPCRRAPDRDPRRAIGRHALSCRSAMTGQDSIWSRPASAASARRPGFDRDSPARSGCGRARIDPLRARFGHAGVALLPLPEAG